eukprot:2464322-Rhodomonas_salina.1
MPRGACAAQRRLSVHLRRIFAFALPALSIPLADPIMSCVDAVCEPPAACRHAATTARERLSA